jgi:hypothetical protein
MPERIIEMEIDNATGDFELKLSGFKGKGCKDVAKAFEKLGTVKAEETTTEYHEQPTTTSVKTGGSN